MHRTVQPAPDLLGLVCAVMQQAFHRNVKFHLEADKQPPSGCQEHQPDALCIKLI